MNKGDFFIMMYHPNLKAIPIIDEDENVLFFSTEDEAREVADNHDGCINLGYEIFEMGNGS